jgi:hypothetical protein
MTDKASRIRTVITSTWYIYHPLNIIVFRIISLLKTEYNNIYTEREGMGKMNISTSVGIMKRKFGLSV